MPRAVVHVHVLPRLLPSSTWKGTPFGHQRLCGMRGLELSGWPLSSNVMTRMPGSSGCTKVLPTGQS